MSYEIPSADREFDVAGLGNALVDALVRIDDDALLTELSLTRGHMHPVNHEEWEWAFARVEHLGAAIHSGGSCANTVATMGLLGARALYCGQIGDDALGRLYAESMTQACGQHALRVTAQAPTGKVLSIISGVDAERTMLTDLAAAVQLPDLGDFAAQIARSRLLHVTGYLLLGEPMRTRALEAIQIARAHGVPVSLDAADPFVVETVGELMWETLAQSADIVFLNAEEASTLCKTSPQEALEKVAAVVDTVVVKLGREGSLVRHRGADHRAGVHRVHAIDTTGAGDAYAAGFLYGLLQGWSPSRCADLGSRVAAMAVSQVGAVVRDRQRLAQAITDSAHAL